MTPESVSIQKENAGYVDGNDVGALAFIDRALDDVEPTVRPGIELDRMRMD